MKYDFDFILPPKQAGVYAIIHNPTKRLYIGGTVNLHRRFNEWRGVANTNVSVRSGPFAILNGSKADEWTFQVVEFCDKSKLDEREGDVISRLAAVRPDLVLNSYAKHTAKVAQAAAVRKSVVLDDDGVPMGYAQAAKMIGCTPITLTKRLSRYRMRGVFQVELKNLIYLTNNPGRPPKN